MVLVITRKLFSVNKIKKHAGINVNLMCKKNFGGVKFLDANRTADESIYFKKEDEALLRNLLKANPNINPDYDYSSIETGMNDLSHDLALVFSKHGIKGLDTGDAIKDIIKVFELNGYRKSLDS
ncbi:conserved Plasmodium protein, unknown function [Plasmodium chabaudi chabaudi]|uniref:Uncharacterized protein n=1 Tax=Plasmodium chabaudi chabaudi TaxID=31271 RepID=A0A077TV86_PLACU|nr:conserved protein, unknown function [Plasmodium chabaudi chabaudi]SCM26003.1 conserved Plasmodium protein, unknown function [Plasmodium chabaudi chabaudi]SCN62760.1 conserved Plasmodium protein, unknown function [Plasmodium chabaudi chabaudi]VTZ70824.1 conserved protein, unknown function [Plasmodium chabaudi chabaudi]|eukprot:XP_016654859.1 conserved Plasmodium protein, unknown function [Plasmodium chabaudi chabaudi]